MRCLRSEGPSYWFNKTKHLIEAILDKHQNISYSNIWQLNDYWGIVQKASTLQNMAIEKHLIIEWVTGWVSEAWPIGKHFPNSKYENVKNKQIQIFGS